MSFVGSLSKSQQEMESSCLMSAGRSRAALRPFCPLCPLRPLRLSTGAVAGVKKMIGTATAPGCKRL